jgi:cation diffusion facilitator family transporter
MTPKAVTQTELADRRRMRIALAANLAMFITGLFGWYLANSTSLLADAFDMLADASGYVVALIAIGRSVRLEQNAAKWNGAMLILLGAGVISEVVHRYLTGSHPEGTLIIAFAILSLIVNGSVLRMLDCYRHSTEVQLRATWIDTRADVVVNLSVLASGIAIALTDLQKIDPGLGLVIGLYVIKERLEIWGDAGET